jgi:cell shape-determining protein MreD
VRRALAPAVVVTLLIVALQLTVLSSLRIEGVVVMLVWLWPFAMGLTGYTSLALVTALLAGVFFDTHTTTPFGLTAAVGLVIAYGASRLGREGVGDLDSAAWWVTPVLAAVAGFVAPALYVVSGAFALNFNLWRGSVLSMMLVNAGAFFILARPVTRLARIVGNVGERVHR